MAPGISDGNFGQKCSQHHLRMRFLCLCFRKPLFSLSEIIRQGSVFQCLYSGQRGDFDWLVWRNSYVSCSYLVELMFWLELDV